MPLLPLLLSAAALGLLIGTLSGMFGVGGGSLMVPFLHLVFGLPMLNASATSLFAVVPTSLSGAVRHIRQKTVDIREAFCFGIPGAAASMVSAGVVGMFPEIVILVITVLVILLCALRVFSEALKKPLGSDGRTSAARFKSPQAAMAASMAVGLVAGFIAGIVGIGGGFIIVPFGVSLLGKTMKEISAISLLAIAIIALPGIIVHAVFSHIEYLYGLALIVGTIPGASFGVWLLPRIPEKALRISFGCLLVISGIILIVNKVVVLA